MVVPPAAQSQDVRSPLEVLEGIVRAEAVLSAQPRTPPSETGPLFIGFAPGEAPTEETRRFLDLCALEGSSWKEGTRETLFDFRGEGDLIPDDGVLVEIQSAIWEEEGISVEFTSYATRQDSAGGSEIWAHPSQVLFAAPGSGGENWAMLSWTSRSGFPVERPLEPIDEAPQPGGLESEVLALSALLAEQSLRISRLEEVIADLKGEVQALRDTPGPGAISQEADPVFTPYTVSPVIKNREEVRYVLMKAQQPLLAEGVGGTVHVWFLIDEQGAVQRAQLIESSGHPLLDSAAMKVADVIQFTPALNRDNPVPVWISYPITFTVRS